jgi:hypothetical protein
MHAVPQDVVNLASLQADVAQVVVGQGVEVGAVLLPMEWAKEAVEKGAAGGTSSIWGHKDQGSNHRVHIIALCK